MNRNPARTASLCLALASLGATASLPACSTQSDGTDPGDSVLVEGTQHVVWNNLGGGFTPPIPTTASCQLQSSFAFDVSAGSLSWSMCGVANGDYGNPAAYSAVTGSRVLTVDERAQVTAATRAVKVTNTDLCGADKPALTLEIDAPSGSIVYGDDFYSCEKTYAHYVQSSALDQLGELLRGMAHNP